MRRLSQSDLANFLVESPTTPMQIAIAGVLSPGSLVDGAGLRLAEARERIARRLPRAPVLRQRILWTHVGQGQPVWIDDARFELERHVVFPSTAPMSEASFLQWCANDAVRTLDREHPLWRISFVPNIDGGNVGVLIVLHHALADGLAGVALVGALFEAEPGATPPEEPWRPAAAPGAMTLVLDNVSSRLRSAAASLLGFPSFVRRLSMAWRPLMASVRQLRTTVPATPLPHELGPRRQLRVLRRGLEPLRDAGRRRGAKLNDLVLAAVTRGLRHWLLANDAAPDAPLRASVPIGSTTTNANSVMLVPLPVGTDDSSARLATIVQATRAAKQAFVPFDLSWLPGPLSRLWLRWAEEHGASYVNLYVTNVAGPTSALWLGDARLTSPTPISPLVARVALSIAVFSYDGELSVSVHADGAAPDLGPLVDGIGAEFDAFLST